MLLWTAMHDGSLRRLTRSRFSILRNGWPSFRRVLSAMVEGRSWLAGRGWLQPLACLGWLVLLLVAAPVQAAAVGDAGAERFRCDGAPLTATLHGGAVDDPTIPNASAGTLPGAFVQLQWQQDGGAIALQLPRTNNSGAPSFTDGKWWWSLEDPSHPRFRLRQGSGVIQDIACEPA